MPPKGNAGKEKDIAEEDEVLQAVILADSFNKRFKPLTVGKPRCLIPVCNAPLLDWTFESLALAGVQEIFVICRSYAEQVKAAIQESKWSKPSSGIKIVPIITSKETFTPGDAMRDIYTHGIITTDFVLVTGDLVSNVKIDEVVRIHKERRKKNKDAIMTIVVKPSGGVHRTKSKGDSGVFVLDAQTSECLHYEAVVGYPPTKHINVPREILEEHPEVEIRYDLIDCAIDVCSVEVPSLFQDNFDYGDIRRDFVHGVLTSDLLMKNIYCYVLQEGYAARVADTRSYDAVSKDILSRWTFPLVPDDNHPGGHSYEHTRGNRYIAKDDTVVLSRHVSTQCPYAYFLTDLILHRTCKVGTNTLIGSHTTVASGANITASVIGQRCMIGPDVVLSHAYIFDDTVVGAGSTVTQSIVGSQVRIGEGSQLERGCLVGDGVVLGKNVHLAPFSRVSRRRDLLSVDEGEESEEEWDEIEQSERMRFTRLRDDLTNLCYVADDGKSNSVLGEGSNAIVWPQGPWEDDEELDEVERFDNQRLMRLGDSASDLFTSEPDDSDSGSDTDGETSTSSFAPLSRTSSRSSFSHAASSTMLNLSALSDAAAESEFKAEVVQSLERAFAEGHTVENASVELKTLRMASNVPLRRVREAVVGALVERIPVVPSDMATQRKEIAQVLGRWGQLIDKIGGVDPVETCEVLQYHCATSTRLPLFGQILAALYQDDIVDEDDIRAWHTSAAGRGTALKPGALLDGVKHCWSVGGKLLQQFDAQASESEEESDEEDEE
ncbi:hypothetical protein EIP86_004158 [Pleurotus ostreatoroseus]|nr:hypothetical protein EIP86_004158 [Pleurotus ostreatoroseus]